MTHAISQRIAAFWQSLGGELKHPVMTNLVWIDLKKAGIDPQRLRDAGKEKGVKLTRGRLVIDYQIVRKRSKAGRCMGYSDAVLRGGLSLVNGDDVVGH
jgi:threonine aldolase